MEPAAGHPDRSARLRWTLHAVANASNRAATIIMMSEMESRIIDQHIHFTATRATEEKLDLPMVAKVLGLVEPMWLIRRTRHRRATATKRPLII